MDFQYNDGGRKESGFKGEANDCVVRAISICTGLPYVDVYSKINELGKKERRGKRKCGKSNSRTGVFRECYDKLLKSMGWSWKPTMFIGSGCKIHMKKNELPNGKLIVALSKHLTAVVDGVCNDTHDPSRDETRCVYGYYFK